MKNFILFTFCALLFTSCGSKSNDDNKQPTATLMTDEEVLGVAKEIDSLFNTPEQLREGLKSFEKNGKYGFVNQQGEIVIPARYDYVGVFNEGLASFDKNGKCGYINHNGEEVIKAEYDYADYFSQGLAVVGIGEKHGYINKNGEVVIELKYDFANSFFDPNGFAAVRLNGKEGLIDRTGAIIMPIQYERAWSTSNGVAHIFDGPNEIKVYNDRSYEIISYR